jgi:magnesium transporter
MATTNKVMTYENLEHRVYEALAHNNLESLKAHLATQHPANIAAVLDRLNHSQRHQVFTLLAPAQQAKVLDEMSTEATQNVLDILSPQEVGALLNYMPMDEAARLLAEDVPKRQAELLEVMSPEHAADVRTLLQYPPESAGRMMTEKFARVQPELTAAETLAYLRQIHPEVETLTDLYALNPAGQLIGVVSLRDVVVAAPERRIDELMNTELVSVGPDTDREEVARLVSHYDYLAMPVVTPDKHMLGIIPVDDVIDALVAEQTEDIMKFGGLEGGGISNQPYFTVPLPMVIRKRVGWLFLLFVAETFTGTVLRHFEDELAKVVALSFFIPLLIGTGGNTGAQTVSTLIRGLALGQIQMRDIWRVIQRELLSGLLMGSLLGIVAFGRALLWGSSTQLSLVVGLTIVAICTWANTIGALIPLLAYRLSIDPAVVSAPLITTLVDATGLAIYMLIAKAILGL